MNDVIDDTDMRIYLSFDAIILWAIASFIGWFILFSLSNTTLKNNLNINEFEISSTDHNENQKMIL